MSESYPRKRGLGGIFHKETEKKDDEKSVPEKKKKHKRQHSIASTKAWRLENCEELTEPDGAQMSSEVKALNEKEKPKKLRRRLPFSALEDPASHFNEGEQSSQRNDEEDIGEQRVSQNDGRPEDEVEESWVVLTTADVVSQVSTSKVSSGTKETESSTPAETCPTQDDKKTDPGNEVQDDSSVKTINPKPEGPKDEDEKIVSSTAILWDAFTHLKQLVLNNEKLVHVDAESSSSHYEICLYAYDFSLAKLKLIALWSFLLTRVSEASKKILVYCISSLIKKYPHCFKIQLKKKKRRRNKGTPKEIASQTTEEE